MDSFKEAFPLPKEFPFSIFHATGQVGEVPYLHWHDCLELNYIISGTGSVKIGKDDYEIKPGQIFVLNNHEPHYAFSDGSLDMIVIIFEPSFVWQNNVFDYEFLKPFFERSINFRNTINPEEAYAKDMAKLILEIEEEKRNSYSGYKLVIKASLMKLLALLYRHFQLEGQVGRELIELQNSFQKIKPAVLFIEKEYTRELKLDEIAEQVFMNTSYFSSFFKKVMKTGVSEYILLLRVNHALRLLNESEKSITEICMESGFNNTAYFSRVFKKFTNYSPQEYRKR